MKRAAGLLLCLLFAVGAAIYYRWHSFVSQPLQANSQEKSIVLIERGLKPSEILKRLESAGILPPEKREWMTLAGRVSRAWGSVKAGEYEIPHAATPLEVFSMLSSGISVGHPLTIREGANLYEIAQEFESKGFARAADVWRLANSPEFIAKFKLDTGRSGKLEGYFYPETYLFNRTQSLEDMLATAIKKHQSLIKPEQAARAKALGLTWFEIITLASVIEKETGAPEERPLISAVFHNRLKKRMRLQSDPTTIYGIWERYQSHGANLRKTDLFERTPYNTYAIDALPLGPIGNPGQESIQAALYPATSPHLYFVSRNDGTHVFSETLEAHNRAVKDFQMNAAARAGKSWRDLSEKKKNAAKAP